MLTLPLEPTDDRANPIFKDAASCAQWLGQLQLTNLQLAHQKLLYQINELNRYPMRAMERLNTLEALRETVSFLQEDFSKKLIDKPLPLNEIEFVIFMSLVQLWQAMLTGYQRCLQAYIAGDKQLAEQGALLCQRCVHYSGLAILEHLRAAYEVGEELWHQLHALYRYAEQNVLHQIDVTDLLNGMATNCTSNYVKILLICYAKPVELTRRQLQLLDLWLSAWRNTLTLSASYTISKNEAPPLAANLSSAQGLQPLDALSHNDALRFLAMMPLSKLLRVKIILLQQGQTPKQVGLGDQLDAPSCLEFLSFLHRCWCGKPRSTEQRPKARHTTLSLHPDNIYALLSGKPLRAKSIDRLALNQIATLGQTRTGTQKHAKLDRTPESWLMDLESMMGSRLTRPDEKGGRIQRKQLIALRPAGVKHVILATSAWVQVTQKNRLQIGVKYFPGQAHPVLISAAGNQSDKQETPAFLLPATPSLKTPASLILPINWFKPKRIIKVLQADGKLLIAHLGFSVERGFDYEHVSFTSA